MIMSSANGGGGDSGPSAPEAEASAVSGPPPPPPPPRYSLRLFQTLQNSQNEHGSDRIGGASPSAGAPSALSSDAGGGGDDSHRFYASYRRYCTAKIARTVRRRAVRRDLVHSHRYASAAAASASASAAGAANAAHAGGGGGKGGGGGRRAHHHHQHAYCPRDAAPLPSARDGSSAGALAAAPVVQEDHLWNLAYLSERSWARACEIMHRPPPKKKAASASAEAPAGGGPRRSNQVVRKLNKAARWSLALWELSEACCDAASAKECRSYHLYLKGTADLERKRYGSALEAYRQSLSLLLELAAADLGTSSSAAAATATGDASTAGLSAARDLALRDVWTTRAESLLRPLVRFCEYESRLSPPSHLVGGGAPEEDAAAMASSPSAAASVAPREGEIILAFRGRRVALDPYQDLAVLYLKMERHLLGGGGGGEASAPDSSGDGGSGMDEDAFLVLSNDLDAGMRMVQAEVKRYEGLPEGPAVAAKRADLRTIRQYFEYHKLVLWREQQERRLSETKTDADLLYVYDTLLQNALSTAELQQQQAEPGGSGSGGGGALLDDPIWLETQAHVLRFRAFRCYYLARHYEDAGSGGAPMGQAAALYGQAEKLAARAREEALACDGMEAYADALEVLLVRVRASQCRMQALELLRDLGAPAVAATDRPLWMRLNDWDPGTAALAAAVGRRSREGSDASVPVAVSLADSPPLMLPVPCKPSFFDVAWQHVPRDDGAARGIAEYIASREPRRGFLEWVRGGWK